MNYSPEEINKILSNYTKKKEYEKQRYTLIKDTDELFAQKNKEKYELLKSINYI